MGKILVIIFAVLIFRFIIKYVVPIFHMTRMAKQKLGEMQRNMEDMQRNQQPKRPNAQRSVDGEYIDYEEVK